MFETIFYQPVLNLLVFIYNHVPGHDFGLSIILLTVIIKLILLPLSRKSLESQKALQDLQPKIEEIKKKYKDKKEEMGRAMMDLYRVNKVNPLSSCLPLIIQLPFLFAVFRVFRNGLNGGSLDLVYSFINKPEAIDFITVGGIDLQERNIVIAVLAGIAQFWVTKMMMAKRPAIKTTDSKDEDMMALMNKQMMYFMPVLTVMIGISFPGGLALYWLVTTILTGLQQMIIFKKLNNNKKTPVEGRVVKK